MGISVSREHNSLEFFVGSSDQAVIAGLLAEFGHELNRRLNNKGLIQKDIKHLDLMDKDRVGWKSQVCSTDPQKQERESRRTSRRNKTSVQRAEIPLLLHAGRCTLHAR